MTLILFLLFLTVFAALIGLFYSMFYYAVAAVFGNCAGIAIFDYVQIKHSITRNFPLFGCARYVAEWLRPKISTVIKEWAHSF